MTDGVSVVVATRDRPALLEKALAALDRCVRANDEVLVVDSASRNDAIARVAARYPRARLIRSEDAGTSRARNIGWRAATHVLVAFIDDDCVVSDGWTDAIARLFSDARVGFATGRVLADRTTSVGISVLEDERSRRFDAPVDPRLYGHGSNMAFRREALQSVGGFDEVMGPGTTLRAAEDQDIFWRLARAGWHGVYDPDVTVTHLQWRSQGAAISRQFSYGVGAAALCVKMIRARDPLGWPLLRAHLWAEGFRRGAASLVRGRKGPALASIVKAAGVVVGLILAWRSVGRGDPRAER